MPSVKTMDQTGFRRILARNVALPLAIGVGSALIFVAVITYLLSVLSMVEHSEKVIGHANEAAKLSVDQESGLRGYLLSNDEAFLAPYTLSKAKTASTMESLTKLVADNPPQVERLRQIMAMQDQWTEYANSAIALRRANNDVITLVRSGRGRVAFDEIRKTFDDFLAVEQRLLQQRNESAQSVTRWGVTLYLLVSLVLSGLLAYFGRRELMRLSEVFGDAIDQHRTHGEALERQAWLRSGQTRLAERSIGHNSLSSLGRASLDFMAEYTGAAVAALYARDEEGSLRRVAGYGMSKEELQREISYDGADTLVGQALLSKRAIVMGNLPDHYLKVSSGIGSGSPRHLVLIPVDNDGVANGVIEFGFLNEPRKRDLEFLELVAPNIGRAIEAALARRRLQDALAETQQLNEELQVQQEELRTANEELEEQSRVLEESQTILENQKAELEQTNERLAEQANALDEKNSALGVIQHELEERALDLQRASKYKSEFLANMSHELRTPLNSSLILSKLLSENARGNLEPEQIQFANTIYAAGNDLLNLINDILDISKVEAGKLELAPEDIALSELTDTMNHTFGPLAGQKQLTFTAAVEAGAPLTLHSDGQRLQQILKNLLSNAIKFTDAGQVSLTIEARPDGMLAFVVRDSGIGIAPDQHAIIFEAFRQADGTTSRRYGGTGLGLSISRDLAALLGGSIAIASSPGKGSTFTLLLPPTLPAGTPGMPDAATPAAPRAALAPPAAPASALRAPVFADDRERTVAGGRTVLVIEDDVSFARILFDLAHEMHYRCLVAHSAADGLQAADDFLPDAILLDLGLPDGSGLDVLQKLKDNPRARHIPVHIVSANDRAEAALQLGAIGYVIKPATRDRLKEVFRTLEGKFTQKLKRVLLVEDDERQRQSVVHLIDDADVEITAVATGGEAFALLQASVYDCMIIDLKLPDMQGHELLRKMAAEEIVSFPPVIVYTGRNLTRAEEAELLKYSRSIIIKGARSPERLLDEVTLFLHKVESQMSAERQSMLKTVRSRDRVFDGRRILLVDDDVRNIFSLTSALEQKGITVEVGRNGFEALERLDQIPDMDLVLMDVMMPGMDGLEATRRLRADPRFAKLPVIAITAKAMKDDQEQCMKAGASDYLAKPIDLDRLYSLLRVWLPSMERL
ncbi:two-component system sensor histidine kinase/response regulator [Massilia violaceinigra]|uniref:Virulence sensor protein BvgS n=1 Tax=Massilia violaceinigra TaxID=2045208 RepID=A0A2D2DH27_9BURK|nr:response regulator [Massilia violaceinigra]ATQ74281.1 two-component system sensor histidine kinase/response regulator [Massilia violaceinigra]